ncbi:hypothetical protein HZF02_32205 (plasmid) [Pseudomonas yamanorum]|nr:hypothetical protein HZF02_32205 [Pseudomonas yamanorum]
MNIEKLLAKVPGYHPPIAWLTAGKDRIRWLSRSLECSVGREGELQQQLTVQTERVAELEVSEIGEWGIDTTAGRPILVYKGCSVIEDVQAYQIIRMLKRVALLESRLEECITEMFLALEDHAVCSAMTVVGRTRFLELVKAYHSTPKGGGDDA